MTVTFAGSKVTLKGNTKKVGDKAEDFTVIDNGLSPKSLKDFTADTLVISVVPSLDTGVCDYQTKKFNQMLNDVENCQVLTISNDLPFAQKRWCASEGLDNIVTLSDHKNLEFAHAFGTLIEEHRLQARAVFVLDKARNVTYVEYVNEVTDHPDYDAVIKHVN